MKIPKWIDVQSCQTDIMRWSWASGTLRVQFQHPVYYYRYSNVPEAIWLILKTTGQLCLENNTECLRYALRAVFDGLIKNRQEEHPFKKCILKGRKP